MVPQATSSPALLNSPPPLKQHVPEHLILGLVVWKTGGIMFLYMTCAFKNPKSHSPLLCIRRQERDKKPWSRGTFISVMVEASWTEWIAINVPVFQIRFPPPLPCRLNQAIKEEKKGDGNVFNIETLSSTMATDDKKKCFQIKYVILMLSKGSQVALSSPL